MLKQSLFTSIIAMTSISICSSLQGMEVIAKITDTDESYSQQKPKYILCAHFDKAKKTYSAYRYWDADCITYKEDGQKVFNMLKARYASQKKTMATTEDTDKSAE